MAITKALMYARLSSAASTGTGLNRKMRVAATRLNFFGPKVLCTVNGTARTYNFNRDEYRVTQRRRGQPTELQIEFFGFTPTVGQEVILGAGALTNRLFRGKITRTKRVIGRQNEGRTIYACTCLSWAYDVDAVRHVSAKFTSSSATDIVTTLMAAYAPAGFTTLHVQTGLATLDEIQFTMQTLNEALQQICDRIGGYFYWDHEKDLHLFTTDASISAPEALTSTNKHVHGFTYDSDIEDLRNRIFVEGDGSTLACALTAGFTTIPVEDAGMFSASGGSAKLEAQNITYTGVTALTSSAASRGLLQSPLKPSGVGTVVAGQSGGVMGAVSYKVVHRLPTGDSEASLSGAPATVAAVAAPSSAPLANLTGDSGKVTAGVHSYKVTYETSKGETLASAASGNVTVTAVTGPSAPSAAATTNSGDVTPGSHAYKVTFQTTEGETLASTASGSTTVTSVSEPGSAPTVAVSATVDAGVTPGARKYMTTFVTAEGETLAGTRTGASTISPVTPPSTVGMTVTPGAGGSVPVSSTYYLGVSYVTAAGETDVSVWGIATTSGVQNRLSWANIPTSADGRVTARKLWRSPSTFPGLTTMQLLTTINDNTTTTYTDNSADASLGALMGTTNTTGGRYGLTSIPTSADARVTKRRLYRTAAGGAVYMLLTTINDNSTTTYTDSAPDTSLGQIEPEANTAGYSTVAVTSIPVSVDARVVRRKLYRTAAGGSAYKYLATIGDNSTTSYTDSQPDDRLGDDEPITDTAGTTTVTLSAIPVSADTRVLKRVVYRTLAGGSIYLLVGTIPDNTTTTYIDNVPDAERNSRVEPEPTTDLSGGGVVTITVPVGGATVTARKIYRTEAGGSVWKFLGTIDDNTTTSYTDNKADSDLGENAPDYSTVRIETGSTTLRVDQLSSFGGAGWVRVGNQVIRYVGRSGTSGEGTLNNVPASGVGSITAPIPVSTAVSNVPHLTGVPASGAGALAYAVSVGDPINLFVQVDDATSQATYGVREYFVQDRRLGIAGATTRANAELALRKDPRGSGSFISSDPKLHAGAPLTINNWGVSATVVVEQVTTSSRKDRPQPIAEVQIASRTTDDLYAVLREMKDRLNQ